MTARKTDKPRCYVCGHRREEHTGLNEACTAETRHGDVCPCPYWADPQLYGRPEPTLDEVLYDEWLTSLDPSHDDYDAHDDWSEYEHRVRRAECDDDGAVPTKEDI